MNKGYRFLPFRFKRFQNHVLMVNDIGEYCFVEPNKFSEFVTKTMNDLSDDFMDLVSNNMICDRRYLSEHINLLATKYRTKKQFLYEFTVLHMLVVTQRCNQKCIYCHASSEDEAKSSEYDMSLETAKKCIDCILLSPSNYIKIEYQGGEPLLNFSTIKESILYAEENKPVEKRIEFVICTNLSLITREQLQFIKEHDVYLSVSLDGPHEIHDSCRKNFKGNGSYEKVIEKLRWVQAEIGKDRVSALMTVTAHSLNRLDEVVDEYINQGLSSIFIRMLNPYGMAVRNWESLEYSVEDFIAAYKKALNYIIQLNLSGIFFCEELATLLLTKILTPFSTGFVDLQSPTGAGIGGAIYEVNGDVYVADEGRMLAKMTGDRIFRIGNVFSDIWPSIFGGDQLKQIVNSSCLESLPGCAWCAYQPYCGSDPVRNYIETGKFSGNPAKSDFCKKYKALFDILFEFLLNNDEDVMDVFWSWITNRNLSAIQISKRVRGSA